VFGKNNFAPVTRKQKLAFDDERCAPIIRSVQFTTKTLHDGGVLTLATTIYQKKKFHVISSFPRVLIKAKLVGNTRGFVMMKE